MEVLRVLADAQAELESVAPHRASLCPGRQRATSLVALGELAAELDEAARLAHARALAEVARGMAQGFPGNLFWDLDFLAARLLDVATRSGAGATLELGHRVAALNLRFGVRSTLQFQYTHDFLYGFDWARWVRKDPQRRAAVGPFDEGFIAYLERRGAELEALIDADDRKYPRLPRGAARNPFTFSRAPEAEGRLHRDLAQRGCLPLEAWRVDALPRWTEPFAELRAERARSLGLAL